MDEAPLFDAILTPHRSLPPRAFLLFMAALASLSFSVGLYFILSGAWPVFGFLGLEVFLVWGAFRLNYRSARQFERLVLTREALAVRRVTHYGEERAWSFQPAWVRVEIEEPAEPDTPLLLRSHGRRLSIGSFLSAPERVDLAKALRAALAEARRAPGTVGRGAAG